MKNREIGILLVAAGVFLVGFFYIIEVYGYNPMKEYAIATVRISSNCYGPICFFDESSTTVTFSKVTPVRILPMASYVLPCYIGPIRVGGIDVLLKFSVPASNYYRTQGPYLLCGGDLPVDFRFPLVENIDCYSWELTVLDKNGNVLYSKNGEECFT